MCTRSNLISHSKGGYAKSGFDTKLRPDPTRSASADQAEVAATERTASCVVVNNWGEQLTNVTLRHRYRNNPEHQQEMTWPSLSTGAISTALRVQYWTGIGTGFDYWWIQFEDARGKIWSCKQNFYCSLESEDGGHTIYFFLSGAAEEMQIQMISSGCEVSLYQS
ncbi:hypothetical protein [Sorangium sp. So ce385]|uniref:hypothetical protein n=1 Tax=Sorangium sp. So ce385 TaxID=3133308 RepID=UPI003F5AFB20